MPEGKKEKGGKRKRCLLSQLPGNKKTSITPLFLPPIKKAFSESHLVYGEGMGKEESPHHPLKVGGKGGHFFQIS